MHPKDLISQFLHLKITQKILTDERARLIEEQTTITEHSKRLISENDLLRIENMVLKEKRDELAKSLLSYTNKN